MQPEMQSQLFLTEVHQPHVIHLEAPIGQRLARAHLLYLVKYSVSYLALKNEMRLKTPFTFGCTDSYTWSKYWYLYAFAFTKVEKPHDVQGLSNFELSIVHQDWLFLLEYRSNHWYVATVLSTLPHTQGIWSGACNWYANRICSFLWIVTFVVYAAEVTMLCTA